MAKIFSLQGDDYLVLKMFDFHFFKSKSRLPLFEQKCSKTEKKLLRKTENCSVYMFKMFRKYHL